MHRLLIKGIAGKPGSNPTSRVLNRCYQVHSNNRRTSTFTAGRIHRLRSFRHTQDIRHILHCGGPADERFLCRILQEARKREGAPAIPLSLSRLRGPGWEVNGMVAARA